MKKLFIAYILLIPMMMIAQPPHGDWDKSDRKNMKTMNIWKLTEELELSEEQAEKFFPKFRAQQEKMEKLREEGKESLKPIFESLKEGKDISESVLNDALMTFERLEQQKINDKIAFIKSLDGTLTNTQRAKLMIAPHKMRREAKDNIKKHKKSRNRRHKRDRW
ncbi:MAG TPA: hypothetical protein EYO79_06145 [Candidatus Marinimicrobia bacterium]|nr:hypothetical protein [Candidatus Neomarinimicrobiota bacterium]